MTKINITSGGGSTFTGGTIAGPLTVTTGPVTLSSGQVLLPDGSETAPSVSFSDAGNTGFYRFDSTRIGISNAGSLSVLLQGGTFWGIQDGFIIRLRSSGNVAITSDADNVLAIRNTTNAQSVKIYTSFTDVTNYERLGINTVAGTITLAAETLGSGTDNIDIALVPAGTGNVKFGTYAAGAASDSTGYITILDAGGTPRKLMVQA